MQRLEAIELRKPLVFGTRFYANGKERDAEE